MCLFLVGQNVFDNALWMAWDSYASLRKFCLGNCNSSHIYMELQYNFPIPTSPFTSSCSHADLETGVYRLHWLHHSEKVGFVLNRASSLWWCWRILFSMFGVGKLAMGKFHLKDSNEFIRESRWMKHSFTCGWNFVPGGFGTVGLITKRPSMQFYLYIQNIYIF